MEKRLANVSNENALVDILQKDLIFLNEEYSAIEDVIQHVGQVMKEKNIVKDTYSDAVIDREKILPTGLSLSGQYGIAIPHTDSEHVNESAIALITLKNPINVCSMINPDESIPVKIVMLLAIHDPKQQVVILKELMGLFKDVDLLKKIENTKNPAGVFDLLKIK